MATVKIFATVPVVTKRIEKDFYINSSLTEEKRSSVINSTLPFRIKFMAVQIESAGLNAVPPIPLQIIGYSNYIL